MSKVEVYKIRFNQKTKEVESRIDVTELIPNKQFDRQTIINVLEYKRDALNGRLRDEYHEIIGIDYNSLNIPSDLKEFIPNAPKNTEPSSQLMMYDGTIVDIFDIKPEDVDIEVIVRGACRINRFLGQTLYPYPVASHLISGWQYLEDQGAPSLTKQQWLIHEAFESYSGVDLPSPLKAMLPAYKEAENKALDTIAGTLGVDPAECDEVKNLDRSIMVAEALVLTPNEEYWRNFAKENNIVPLDSSYVLPHQSPELIRKKLDEIFTIEFGSITKKIDQRTEKKQEEDLVAPQKENNVSFDLYGKTTRELGAEIKECFKPLIDNAFEWTSTMKSNEKLTSPYVIKSYISKENGAFLVHVEADLYRDIENKKGLGVFSGKTFNYEVARSMTEAVSAMVYHHVTPSEIERINKLVVTQEEKQIKPLFPTEENSDAYEEEEQEYGARPKR
jgi:hypothetical protein